MKTPTSEKWRQANRPVKMFLNLNPSLMGIYLITLFGAKYSFWLSIIVATSLTIFFSVVEYKGVSPLMALRWVRTRIMKNRKRLRPSWVRL